MVIFCFFDVAEPPLRNLCLKAQSPLRGTRNGLKQTTWDRYSCRNACITVPDSQTLTPHFTQSRGRRAPSLARPRPCDVTREGGEAPETGLLRLGSQLRVSENACEPTCVSCCFCLFSHSPLGPALEDSGASGMARVRPQNKPFY